MEAGVSSASLAKDMVTEKLSEDPLPDYIKTADNSKNPNYQYVRTHLLKKYEKMYGKASGPLDKVTIAQQIHSYCDERNILCKTSLKDGHLVISMITPFMLRVHCGVSQSSEICFLI